MISSLLDRNQITVKREARKKMFDCPLSLYVPKEPITFRQPGGEDCFMGGG